MPKEAKRYLVAPDMSYATRAVTVAALFAVGVGVQLTISPIIGVVPVCTGGLLLFARNVSNKAVVGRKRKWENVTMAEFDRARELCNRTAEWRRDFLSVSSGRGFVTLAGLVVAVGIVARFLKHHEGTMMAVAWCIDAAAVLIPLWFSGLRSGWTPAHFAIKLKALENIRGFFEMMSNPALKLQPVLEVATNAKGETVPMDARFMIRFPDGPEDFIGVQVQVSLNDVQGTKFPYLYCVVLAKEGFGLIKKIAAGRVAKGDIIETQTEKDVEVVVVRQHTTKRTGYHTDPNAQRRVYGSAMGLAAMVVRNAAGPASGAVASSADGPATPAPPRAPKKRRKR